MYKEKKLCFVITSIALCSDADFRQHFAIRVCCTRITSYEYKSMRTTFDLFLPLLSAFYFICQTANVLDKIFQIQFN